MPVTEFTEFNLYKGKCKVKFYPNSHRYIVNGKPTSGSVTGILGMYDKSGALLPWAVELSVNFLRDKFIKGEKFTEEDFFDAEEQHTIKKKQAADIGTLVHDWIEKHILGEKPPMPEIREAQIGVNAFLEWITDNKVKFISTERAIYSRKHDYIGKMDIEAKVNGKLTLIDIKTSNGIYNTYNMQTAAYVMADQEESGKKYHGRWIIRLAKESEKEYDTRMAKKNFNRKRKGKEPVDYPPYQVFEAKFLDETAGNLERDFAAFLACKTLFAYEKATGFYASFKN
ncbi:MAG: hypothetical protein ABIR14_02380 [Candidatus Paceibacterota bacterium]